MGIVWVFRRDKSEEHGSYARAQQIDMEETWTVYRCASDLHGEQVAEN
ncbi:hypothetical protein NC652_028052 [Populus alba x Populus x berolinensis]|nr:hypothetical protein NC652_028052 [Populus alba x Populus x berolinensis]